MLRLSPEARDQMFAHAIAELPNEACGMFSRHDLGDIVDYFHPMTNAKQSAAIFALDAQEMLDLQRHVEEAGRSLVGVMHSHTLTSAYPSPTDIRDSAGFDPFGTFHQVIVSLRSGEPTLRCFHIKGELVTEVLVVVDDGTDTTLDHGGAVAVAAVLPLPSSD